MTIRIILAVYREAIFIIALSVLLLAVPLTSVSAQTEHLEEVVVTARKQDVSIQDASIAVSVMTGEDFARSNIMRLDNFNGYAPGLSVTKNDGAGRVVTIRGVGWETAQNLSTQPSVLLYMDGVYIANPLAFGLDLGDLQQIEVYRGPQGTEFGQGTTGGAINLITNKPDFEKFTGDIEVGYGTFDTIKASGTINIPLAENLAVRGSIQKYKRDGFAEIEGGALDGYDLDDADSINAKLALRWQPIDTVSVNLLGFIHDSDQHAAAQKNVLDPNPDPRELSQDFPGIFDLKNYNFSATIEWDTPWGAKVKSLTGWQKLEKRQSVDGDRLNENLTSIDILGFFNPSTWDVLPFWDNDSDAVTQEINITYNGEKLDWILGGYYLHHENFNSFLEANGPSPFSDSVAALANPSATTLPPFASVLNFVEDRTLTRDDAAAFGQLTYRFTDMFSVTGGLRWQTEDQLDESLQFFFIPATQKLSDDKLTWKVGVDINLSENNLVYALVSTGWKNGGTNPGALNGAIQVPVIYKPEEVTAFEIGTKNTFLDDRVRLNVTGFYYDYENLQFMQEDPTPFAGGTGNIPQAEIYGIETEFNWLISDGWRLDGHLTWMDGEFEDDFFTLDVVDFREALAPGVGLFTGPGFNTRLALATSTNLKGNEPPKLVDLAARLALTNTHTFSDGSVLTSRADYIHRGEFQARVFNNPLVDTVPDYNIANLYFQYDLATYPLSVSLTVSNLFDKDGVNNTFSNPFGLLTTSREFIPSREVIGTIRYRF